MHTSSRKTVQAFFFFNPLKHGWELAKSQQQLDVRIQPVPVFPYLFFTFFFFPTRAWLFAAAAMHGCNWSGLIGTWTLKSELTSIPCWTNNVICWRLSSASWIISVFSLLLLFYLSLPVLLVDFLKCHALVFHSPLLKHLADDFMLITS